MVDKKNRGDAVVVLGLGRFGGSLAVELVGRDVEVLGVDSDARTVQQLSGQLTHVVCADSTDPDALPSSASRSSAGPWSASAPTSRRAS